MPRQSFIKSFFIAFEGLFLFFSKERNGQVQLAAASIIIIAGAFFCISPIEWIAIILCIAVVISLEMINSTLEKLSDMVQQNIHPTIKTIKDIAAAAVLWSAMGSAIIGAIIFLPKIIHLIF